MQSLHCQLPSPQCRVRSCFLKLGSYCATPARYRESVRKLKACKVSNRKHVNVAKSLDDTVFYDLVGKSWEIQVQHTFNYSRVSQQTFAFVLGALRLQKCWWAGAYGPMRVTKSNVFASCLKISCSIEYIGKTPRGSRHTGKKQFTPA